MAKKNKKLRTVDQITDEIHGARSWEAKRGIIMKYAEEIINECAGSFECTMEDTEDILKLPNGTELKAKHPVLVRQTVLDVVNKL